jgi:hypothetical protein
MSFETSFLVATHRLKTTANFKIILQNILGYLILTALP